MYDKEMREEQMQDDTILKIENIRKEYVLGTVTGDTLKDALKDRFG